MRLEPDAVLLHYRLIEKIGEGGMGVVWRAIDTALERQVALKLLPEALAADPDRLTRFRREAKLLASLNHPGIVTIHAVEDAAGRPVLVMELLRGRPLRDVIPPEGFTPRRFLEAAVDLVEAVAAAHSQGVTHRDLKPGNVIVTEAGRLKVLDFGLAMSTPPADPALPVEEQLTRTAASAVQMGMAGTLAYMSPEQAEGRPVDARSDVFSLGVLLHEMATGRRPFRGDNPAQILSSILRDEPTAILEARPDHPREVDRTVRRCLQKDPARRYASALDLASELRARRDDMRRGEPAAGRRRGPLSALSVASLLAAAAVALVAAIFLYRQSDGRESASPGEGTPAAPFTARKLSQLTSGIELEQWPSWAPDGLRLVHATERQGFANLDIKDLATGERRPLTRGSRDDIQPTFSPDGRTVAFVRSTSAQGRLEPSVLLTGEYDHGDIWLIEVESGREIRIVEEGFHPAFSPDGARLAMDASRAGPRRIWITDGRGRNPRQATTDSSEAIVHTRPSWSPDGKRIVFQHEEKTRLDLRIVEAATGEVLVVTDDLYPDLDPIWSPDGHIYFSSYRGGGWNIWRIPVDTAGRPTGSPQQLTTGAGQDIQPRLAPGGGRLAFTVLSQNADLWRLPVEPVTGRPSGPPEPLVASTREDSRGAWSPDGRMLAFNSDRDGEMNIWLHAIADGTTRPLTRGPGGDYQPRWSADGGSLVFFSARAGNADVWVVRVADGRLRQITDHVALDTNPSFSPDGSRIAFQSDRDGRKEVWIVDTAGGEPRQLSTVGAADHFLRWSDDGAWVYFRSTALPENGVVRVPSAGGEVEPLGIPVGWHMSFSPDRRRILDVVGHKTIWVHPVEGGEAESVFALEDPGMRIDYPDWSADGRWIVFDRVAPQGGDIWLLEGMR